MRGQASTPTAAPRALSRRTAVSTCAAILHCLFTSGTGAPVTTPADVAAAMLLLLSAALMGAGAARGPHHPRGARHPAPSAGKLTQDTQLLRDVEHIQEDLGDWLSREETSNMSPEELEFHYFKLHDFDNNTKLDGLEILQAIHHTAHQHEDEAEGAGSGPDDPDELRRQDFDYFVDLIDKVLEEDDLDRDGYLSYVEYVVGRQKDEHKRRGKLDGHQPPP